MPHCVTLCQQLFVAHQGLINRSKDRFMEKDELIHIRRKLKKTQKDLAAILAVSLRTIRSYEQGDRTIPPHIERQLYFILSRINDKHSTVEMCWDIKKCTDDRRAACPAWEFRCGNLCWFINGTICQCKDRESWQSKMLICRNCDVFRSIVDVPVHE